MPLLPMRSRARRLETQAGSADSNDLERADGVLTLNGSLVVSNRGTGVVFAGPAGCGKSTTGVLAAVAGWRLVTDGLIVVPPPFAQAVGIHRSPTLDESILQRYQLSARVIARRGAKCVVATAYETAPSKRIGGIVVPRIASDEPVRWGPMRRVDVGIAVEWVGVMPTPRGLVRRWLATVKTLELVLGGYPDYDLPALAAVLRHLDEFATGVGSDS